jgi:hypothetical protein
VQRIKLCWMVRAAIQRSLLGMVPLVTKQEIKAGVVVGGLLVRKQNGNAGATAKTLEIGGVGGWCARASWCLHYRRAAQAQQAKMGLLKSLSSRESAFVAAPLPGPVRPMGGRWTFFESSQPPPARSSRLR